MLRRIAPLILILLGTAPLHAAPPTFERDIAPLLQARCVQCHGPKKQEGALRLDALDQLRRGADGSPVVAPGKPADSELLRRITSTDKAERMPPSGDPLTEAQITLIRSWIQSGTELHSDKPSLFADGRLNHWAWQPIQNPPLPPGQPADSPIDLFIRQKLAAKKLSPSPAATRETLIRRLSFDLLGLPPTPEEITAFTADPNPRAYEHLVDKFLASHRYGERWARHWLDVVHYGDTHGYDKDKPRPHAWPYRDYVIRAFNTDKPYPRFIQEQIAGDVLWPDTRDGNEALGFISAGPWDFIGHAEVPESKIDGKIARHLDRDDMVANTLGTFCSVTIHCAQCHNHKFDPFTQADYYSLQSDFAALDRADRKYFTDPGKTTRYYTLLRQQRDNTAAKKKLEEQIRTQAQPELAELDEAIKRTGKPGNIHEAFGYHSESSPQQNTLKWVQVDLGAVTKLNRVDLVPAYDDFNNIGAGFGFPLQYRVEVCDQPDFTTGVQLLGSSDTPHLPDPKHKRITFSAQQPQSIIQGRYVRVTATKLAPRQNDFIFALAELQVTDAKGKHIATGKPVTALDSIEAPPRWAKSNLVDDHLPRLGDAGDLPKLEADRTALLKKSTTPAQTQELARLDAQLVSIESELKTFPAPELVYAGTIHTGDGTFAGTGAQGGTPRPIHLLRRGDVQKPAELVSPGAIAALSMLPGRFELPPNHTEGDRRVALARWLTDEKNPLTTRSIVNRLWQYHFGRGLVETANDFGKMGTPPSHPELLDWLATDFRNHGGSLKHLHRLIVTSATYKQVSDGSHNPHATELDSENHLLWRQNRRKLEAEAIHDAVLAVSGKLDLKMGGPGYQDFVVEHPEHSPHYEYHLADQHDPRNWRRAIYRFIVRSQTQPFMTSLDCADPSMRVEKRNESVTSLQALAMLNSNFMVTQAEYFATRIRTDAGDDPTKQVDRAVSLALGRPPTPQERDSLTTFLKTQGLFNLSRVLLNLNEFVFVD